MSQSTVETWKEMEKSPIINNYYTCVDHACLVLFAYFIDLNIILGAEKCKVEELGQ